MSQLTDVTTLGAFNKKQLLEMYGNVDMKTFEDWIQDIKTPIRWRKGKQVFPPKVVQQIIEHIGQPIRIKVLN